ncbi:hypothetical protein [Streptomyces violaceus]|uniref:CopG family transcriptional regulator n=1 Tax=Streptomyces violaceus TaxID=1936 RepID=A0ABY9UMP3_STRVL|nr:hypothetical protein [Streptomyces janthinus]WND24088.1 hypothetical protein RI060_42985 [Streptomyces janthinus]GGS96284.1 hypothetical protein GCM10010270_80300 [Streptomyces janthinus]
MADNELADYLENGANELATEGDLIASQILRDWAFDERENDE